MGLSQSEPLRVHPVIRGELDCLGAGCWLGRRSTTSPRPTGRVDVGHPPPSDTLEIPYKLGARQRQ